MPIAVTDNLSIPDADYEVTFARSGGPGGQNVNKVSSKVQLRFFLAASLALAPAVKARLRAACPGRLTDDGCFLVQSEKTRDQKQNLDDAEEKLASFIRGALFPPKPRTKTKPSKGSIRRRLNDKSQRSTTKQTRTRVKGDD
ncbi:MAG: alternative ribosome rescue aminoacyl-tRNA hydrolase ArfB [Deltaproteobacteria bacterium]|nr:alternative ribosome rescue aminoacyl-tRNA hydrolase ArfB [Deltaproteobacteria bacterium]